MSDLPPAVADYLDRQRRLARTIRAVKAAHALHALRPDVAHRAGEAAASRFPGGRTQWARAMALRRWHGVPLDLWR
jgi:hypothetical protein